MDNDLQALKELKRVLKKDGLIFIQTAFKEGNIYENAAIKTNQERLLYFGQGNPVRIYSVDGLAKGSKLSD